MECRTVSLLRRIVLALGVAAAFATPGMAQVQFTFYETYPAAAPDPNLPFAGGSVFCTATAAGSATGFNFNFDNPATGSALCPGNPSRISAVNSFGARITGTLNAPTAGTYSLTLNADDGNRLSINGSIIRTDWFIKASGPGAIGNITLQAGANPFVFDYFQGPCCGAFVQLGVSGGLTVAPPPGNIAVVPEPGSVLLLGTGLLGVGIGAIRRRRAA